VRLASERMADLGLTLPPVPAPVAAYVPAVRFSDLVFTAGQLPLVDGQLRAVGQVGAAVSAEEAYACARIAALNGLAAVADATGDLDVVARVVKVVVYVSSAPAFTGQPQVANGASDLLGEIFGVAGQHARSAVGVASLPLDAPVEVELVVAVGSNPIIHHF
jgi:enamine deaminase RidA (YjgF/YER057c/UK114 family)